MYIHFIAEKQRECSILSAALLRHNRLFSKDASNSNVVTLRGKNYIPNSIVSTILNWYHLTLGHLGASRLEKTLRLNLYWPGLSSEVVKHVRTCHTCQISKTIRKKYGHLPE